jgi:hypothetical protein
MSMRGWWALVPLVLFAVAFAACREPMRSPAQWDKGAMRAWEVRLAEIVTEDGLVDYDALEADRSALDGYVAWLADERSWPGRLTRDWHAQYLNAYNALVMFQVLERGRPASVLDVGGIVPVPGYKFFAATQFALGADWLTLSEIEHERVRWKEMDYRDHSALNCASMSCPPLRNELYRPPQLRQQLDDQMKRWMSDPERGVRVEGGRAVFSPIFEWFERDFHFFSGGKDPCTIAAEHTGDHELARQLRALSAEGCPRTYFEYDWSLNDASSE